MRIPVLSAALAASAVLGVSARAGADLLLKQSFETTSGYTVSNTFYDNNGDYFIRVLDTDPSTPSKTPDISTSSPYIGFDGMYFFAGEDIDSTAGVGDGRALKTILLDPVDTRGYQSLTFTGSFARGNLNKSYDFDDMLYIEASTDGGDTFTKVLQFAYSPGPPEDTFPLINEHLAHDPDLDGLGEGAWLTNVLTDYSVPLPLGDSIVIRFTASGMESGSEEFALDNFRITGEIPEPSSLGLLGAAGLLLMRRRR